MNDAVEGNGNGELRPLREIAEEIARECLDIFEDALIKEFIVNFLENARGFRGPKARALKEELLGHLARLEDRADPHRE